MYHRTHFNSLMFLSQSLFLVCLSLGWSFLLTFKLTCHFNYLLKGPTLFIAYFKIAHAWLRSSYEKISQLHLKMFCFITTRSFWTDLTINNISKIQWLAIEIQSLYVWSISMAYIYDPFPSNLSELVFTSIAIESIISFFHLIIFHLNNLLNW